MLGTYVTKPFNGLGLLLNIDNSYIIFLPLFMAAFIRRQFLLKVVKILYEVELISPQALTVAVSDIPDLKFTFHLINFVD